MLSYRIALICVLFIIPQQIPGLTRQEALDSALRKNPSLATTAADQSKAAASMRQSFWLDHPSLELEWEGLNRFAALGEYETRTITVEQVIPNPVRRYFEAAGRIADHDVATTTHEWTRREVEAQIHLLYSRWVAAQHRVALRTADLEDARRLDAAAEKRLSAGASDQLERLQAGVELRKALTAVREAEQEELDLRGDLSRAMGQPITVGPTDSLAFPPESAAPDSTLLSRLAQRITDAARNRRNGALTSLIPDVAVAGYQSQNSFGQKNWGFRLAATIPIWLFPTWSGDLQTAQAELDAANAEADRIRLEFATRRQILESQWRKSLADAEDYRSGVLAHAEEMLRMARRSHEEGVVDYLHLLEVQRSHREVVEGYDNLLVSLWETWADLMKFRPEGQ